MNSKSLRDHQRKWLEHRDYMAADQPRQNGFEGDDLKQSPDYWEAMADLTKEPHGVFASGVRRGSAKGNQRAFIEDSYGGALKLEETPKGVAFSDQRRPGPNLTHGRADWCRHAEAQHGRLQRAGGGWRRSAALRTDVHFFQRAYREDRRQKHGTLSRRPGLLQRHIFQGRETGQADRSGTARRLDGCVLKLRCRARLVKPSSA